MKRSALYFTAMLATVPIAAGMTLWAADTSSARSLDFNARWEVVQSAGKQDRLTVSPIAPVSKPALSFSDRAARTTFVQKSETSPVKTAPSARDVAPVERRKQKLPFACEPSFSPVTMPAFAHIPGRCLA